MPEILLTLYVFAGVIKAAMGQDATSFLDLTLLLGLLSFFTFAAKALMRGQWIHTKPRHADLWAIGFSIAVGLGVLYSPIEAGASSLKVLDVLVLGQVACYALLRFIGRVSPSGMHVVRNSLGCVVAVATAFAVLAFLKSPGLALARSPGGSYLSWGYMVGVAIIACASFIVRTRSVAERVFLAVILVLLVAALVYARGRGPLLSIVGVLSASLLFIRWIPWRRRLIAVALLMSVLVAGVFLLPENLRSRYGRLLEEGGDDSIIARVEAYQTAWRMFVTSPIIGHGTGSYRAYHNEYSYPHNILLETMAENGIIGLILLLGFIGSVLAGVWRKLRGTDGRERLLVATVGMIFLFVLIGAQFSGDLSSRSLWFTAGLATLCSGEAAKERPMDGGKRAERRA